MKLRSLAFFLISCITVFGQSKRESLIQNIKENGDNIHAVELSLKLAQEMENSSLSSAVFWADNAILISEKINYKKGVFEGVKMKGEIQFKKGNPDSTLFFCEKIFEFHLASSAVDSADIFNLLGIAYQSKRSLDSAFLFLNLAHDNYKKENELNKLIAVMSNLGNCFYEAGNSNQALDFHELSLELARQLDNQEKMPIVLSNYALFVLLIEKDMVKVDGLMNEIEAYSDRKKSALLLATFYQNHATFCMQMNQLGRAETSFLKALDIAENSQYNVHSGVYTGLGMIAYKRGKYNKAIDFYKKGLENVENLSESRLLYSNLIEVFTAQGNSDSASFYWEKKTELIEEIEAGRNQDIMVLSKTNLQILKKENEIKLLEKDFQLTELTNKLRLYTIIGLVLLSLLLLVLAYFLWKQKRKELLLKESLIKAKNQKLMGLSLQITQKNQVLLDFENQLKGGDISEDEAQLLRLVKNKLHSILKIDKDWETFEHYFKDLHEGVYERLKKEHPDLSNNELRICSLAKLRFNLKEIANTLNLSLDSVKSARYRIRKKMNLETSQDLSDYLNTF